MKGPRPWFISVAIHASLLGAGMVSRFWHPEAPYAQPAEVRLLSVEAPRSPAAPPRQKEGRSKRNPSNILPVAADELQVTEMPRLLSEVRIPYPAEARARGIEGTVKVDLLIDESGVVRDSKIIEGPGHGLNEAALRAIEKFRFAPALIEEKPVAVRVRYSYRFVLDR